jgi:hypothetical protein
MTTNIRKESREVVKRMGETREENIVLIRYQPAVMAHGFLVCL